MRGDHSALHLKLGLAETFRHRDKLAIGLDLPVMRRVHGCGAATLR